MELRRSSSSSSSKVDDDDSDLMIISQVKKALQSDDINDSNVASFVDKALRLQSVDPGNCGDYNLLVGVMRHNKNLTPDELDLLVTFVRALARSVSHLNLSRHDSLLCAILEMNIWDCVAYGSDLMDVLLDLIISLASLDETLVKPCLAMLVTSFRPPPKPHHLEAKEQVVSLVHKALKQIARSVPQAPKELLFVITLAMPPGYNNHHRTVLFVQNMLRLARAELFREAVGSCLLQMVVYILVDIDVEFGWDIQRNTKEDIFEMNQSPSAFGMTSVGKEVAKLLDSLMVLIAEHLRSYENLNEVFDTLLKPFRQSVLGLTQLSASQFVLFYACSLDPAHCGVKFATFLVDIFIGSEISHERKNAATYIASYLSRAKFLSPSFTVDVLKRLVDWCLEYCKSLDCNSPLHPNDVFYHGCQAILYVLCFHMRPLLDVTNLKQLIIMPLEEILRHKLNPHPLNRCLPYVVKEFLRQAKAAHLFTESDLFTFDETVSESECRKIFSELEIIDPYYFRVFPFDPCLLKDFHRLIHEKYVYQSMVETSGSASKRQHDLESSI